MSKVKYLAADSLQSLEEKVNKFLELIKDNEILDVKFYEPLDILVAWVIYK